MDGTSKSGDRYAADKVTVKTGSSGGHTEWVRGEGNVRGILAAAPSASGPDRAGTERQYAGEQSMLTLDAQVHAYERNHPGRPWRDVLTGPSEVTGDQMVAAMDAVGVDGAILVSPFSMYRFAP